MEKIWVCWEGIFRVMGQGIEGGGGGWTPLRFGTYNIQNGQNGRLESELRGMKKSNVDVMVFQETKIADGIYTSRSARYKVVATPSPSRHWVGVTRFYRVKSIHQFGTNIIAYKLVTGNRRCYIIGCSLVTGYRETIRYVEAAIAEQPRGV